MADQTYSSQLRDDRPISIKMLNQAFANLVRSDNNRTVDDSDMPGLWEQRWYNERDNSDLYYQVGDAVWVNTEHIDDVVNVRQDELYAYAASNAALRKKLDERLDAEDMSGYLALLKDFALGYIDKRKGPIYFLGDLTANVQIRISLSANNTTYPNNPDYWTDFIFDDTEKDIALSIFNKFSGLADNAIKQHMADFHLSGQGLDKTALSNEYLLKDFSNLSGEQRLKSHVWYDKTLEGFDHVKELVWKKYGDGRVKWYRLWDSGFLEHGGIVNTDVPAPGDVVTDDGSRYDVSLNWTSDVGKASVTYDYPTESLYGFYGNESGYYADGNTFPIPTYASGPSYRPIVTVTAVNSSPYSQLSKDGGHDQLETCFFSNNKFSFIISDPEQRKMFSYKVEGYSVGGSRR